MQENINFNYVVQFSKFMKLLWYMVFLEHDVCIDMIFCNTEDKFVSRFLMIL